MHRRAVVLADFDQMQKHPKQGIESSWQGPPLPPNVLYEGARAQSEQGARIREPKVQGKR